MRYQAWAIATHPNTLRAEATAFVFESEERLEVEEFIEQFGTGGPQMRDLRNRYPRHLVTMQMRFDETEDERNARMLEAFLLLQGHMLPRAHDNAEALDAMNAAIRELTAALPARRPG